MAVDAEKGTLTVIGEVDPILIVERLRKSKMKSAQIVSVGPPTKKMTEKITTQSSYPPTRYFTTEQYPQSEIYRWF